MSTPRRARLRAIEDHLYSAACYLRAVGVGGIASAFTSRLRSQSMIIHEMKRDDVRHPFHLRLPSTDVPTYCEVFLRRDYAFEAQRAPQVIVDAGANIGLSAIFFANLFPDARIYALEPEPSNFQMLLKNVAPYEQITALNVALWNENKLISLVDPGLGEWGFMTEDAAHGALERGLVQALTLDRLIQDHQLDRIDLLKLDVEGAEREVFSDPGAWIDRVDAMIVELHDRMKPGCSRNFYLATQAFELEWMRGPLVGVARAQSCASGSIRPAVERHRPAARDMHRASD